MSESLILVVDDEQDIRDLLVFNLKRDGYASRLITTASSLLPTLRLSPFYLGKGQEDSYSMKMRLLRVSRIAVIGFLFGTLRTRAIVIRFM